MLTVEMNAWPAVITGWSEVRIFIARRPKARMIVEAAGNGAVNVYFPTIEAFEEFFEVVLKKD